MTTATIDAIATKEPLSFTPFAAVKIGGERMYLLADLGQNRYIVLRDADQAHFTPTAQRLLSERTTRTPRPVYTIPEALGYADWDDCTRKDE